MKYQASNKYIKQDQALLMSTPSIFMQGKKSYVEQMT